MDAKWGIQGYALPEKFEIYNLSDAINCKNWGQSLNKLTNFIFFNMFLNGMLISSNAHVYLKKIHSVLKCLARYI